MPGIICQFRFYDSLTILKKVRPKKSKITSFLFITKS